MEKIKEISQHLLDGMLTGEEYYMLLVLEIQKSAESLQADENMAEIAKQLVK